MTASFSVASSRSIVLQFEEVNSVTLLKLRMDSNVQIILICHLCTYGSSVQPGPVRTILSESSCNPVELYLDGKNGKKFLWMGSFGPALI